MTESKQVLETQGKNVSKVATTTNMSVIQRLCDEKYIGLL